MSVAKKHLSKDFTILNPSTTVLQATEQLHQEKVTYGVVVDPKLGIPALMTHGVLEQAANKQNTAGNLVQSLPRLSPVQADTELEPIVRALANDLITDPSLVGLVVLGRDDKVIGVIPRQALTRIAAQMMERGGDTGRLEGASVVAGVYFHCPIDGEEKLVSYYSPTNPPKCSNGHLMKRKLQSE